jgi:Flp pilus assembly protein TadD
MPRIPLRHSQSTPAPVIRAEVLLERARSLIREGQRDQARAICEQILLADPANTDGLNQLGVILTEERRLAEAIVKFEDVIRISPDCVDAWRNRGLALSDLGMLDEALASFDQVVARQPSVASGYALRAMTFYRLGRFEEAVQAHDPILALTESDAAMTANRAAALLWSGRTDEAMAAFERAVTLDPNYPPARVNLAMAQMLLGDYPNGFRNFEWRWKRPALLRVARHYSLPLWSGQVSLAGKTILAYREQGFGDTIQFCRYASLAVSAGARVILEVQPSLVTLLRTLPGGPSVVGDGDSVRDFDLHCPLMALLAGFGTTVDTIPANVPYLFADPARVAMWRDVLPAGPNKKIGLVWAGGSHAGQADQAAYDRRRSTTLHTLAPLAFVPGCDFISLQIGPASGQVASPEAGISVYDHTGRIQDFSDTAALIEILDLVIGVDTSVIHLAGALGKPVWLLNRFDTDWRWLLNRDDSPWYPTLRQFRQTRPGDWEGVIGRVVKALGAFVGVRAGETSDR